MWLNDKQLSFKGQEKLSKKKVAWGSTDFNHVEKWYVMSDCDKKENQKQLSVSPISV